MRDRRLAELLHRTSRLVTGGTEKALAKRGIKLSEQAESTGDLDALDEAIDLLERALDANRRRHPNRALWLSNLGPL